MKKKSMMQNDVIVRVKDNLLTTKVDGDILGISIDQGVCFGFDAITTRVWELLDTPRTFQVLCEQLVEEFDVEPEQCGVDLTRLLQALRNDSLILVRSA